MYAEINTTYFTTTYGVHYCKDRSIYHIDIIIVNYYLGEGFHKLEGLNMTSSLSTWPQNTQNFSTLRSKELK